MTRKSLLKKNKKGSHIGIIVSFTLFITSILFLYSMIGSPLKFTKEKERAIYSLKDNFIKQAQEEVIVTRAYTYAPCTSIPKPSELGENTNFIVMSNETELESRDTGDYILIASPRGLIKTYFTKTPLNQTETNIDPAPCFPIEIENTVVKKVIIESKILEIINDSINNESKVRDELKISNDDEFNLIFIYSNGTEIGERKREIKGNIYARKFLTNYLSQNGMEELGELEIRVW